MDNFESFENLIKSYNLNAEDKQDQSKDTEQSIDTLNDIFFNSHKFNLVVVKYYSKEYYYGICYFKKVVIVSSQTLNNFFSEKEKQAQKTINENNNFIFCSLEDLEKFQKDTSNEIKNLIFRNKLTKIDLDDLKPVYKGFSSKDKKKIINIDIIFEYILIKDMILKEQKNEIEFNNLDKLPKFDKSKFIKLNRISNYIYIYLYTENEQLYIIKNKNKDSSNRDSSNRDSSNNNSRLNEFYESHHLIYPYIQKFYGYLGDSKESIILDFVHGEVLSTINFNLLKLSFAEKLSICFEIMTSIEYLHFNGYIFRDLKPSNIIIKSDKTSVLIDFSSTKFIDLLNENEFEMTSNIGAYCYTSPEQHSTNKYSFSTDVFSIGQIIAFILTETQYNNDLRKYLFFNSLYNKCTNKDPIKRVNSSSLINKFYRIIYDKFKSTLFYNNLIEERFSKNKNKERIKKTLNNLYKIRIKQIKDFIENKSKKLVQQHINQLFEMFDFLTYEIFTKENQEELKIIFNQLIELKDEYIDYLDSQTSFIIGKVYEGGKFVQKNINKALQYYMLSASKNNSDASYRLGLFYEEGKFVKFDINKAIDYYMMSSKENNSDAQYRLGLIYDEGKFIEHNLEKSAKYYALAAKQSNLKSIYRPLEYFVSNKNIFQELERVINEDLINIYKSFNFTYSKCLPDSSSYCFEKMKPFIIFDVFINENNNPLYIICSYDHCYIYEAKDKSDQIQKYFEDIKLFNNDLVILAINDKYSHIFNDKEIESDMKYEVNSLYNYFKKKNPIIYDTYFTSTEEFFVNLTIKSILASLIRKFYFPSNFFTDCSFFPEENNFFVDRNHIHQMIEFKEKEFVFLRKVGQGSFATASLQYHLKTKCIFVLKEYGDSITKIKYYQREKEFYQAAQNDFIVNCYGIIPKKYTFVLDFMSQYSLTKEYIVNLDHKERIKLALSILMGIFFIHKYNFYHRDLKPQNIFINHNDEYRVGDFNCARYSSEEESYYTNDIGSELYSSPYADKSAEYNDLYSFGKIFEEIIIDNTNERNIEDKLFSNLYIFRKEIIHFFHLFIDKDPPEHKNEEIIIRIFYLFSLFDLNEDTKFKEKFIKSYRMLLENFYHNNTDHANKSDIEIIIYLFEMLLNENSSNGHSSDDKNTTKICNNDTIVQFLLGVIYYDNTYILRDINKSIHYLSLSSNNYNSNAQYLLGKIYYEGKGITRDIDKAIYYLSLAANQNNSIAQLYLGKIYSEGLYISSDIDKAIHFISLSANQKNQKAQLLLGKIYYDHSYSKYDINKAIDYFSLAAKQKNYYAQYYLGIIYYSGKYAERDIKKAITFITLAANQDFSQAQSYLGEIYYTGKYVKRDIKKAIHYFLLAKKQNDIKAQFYLGEIYYIGDYFEQDINKAISFFMLSANQNDYYSQYYLGEIYYLGKYVPRDIDKAIYFFTLAAGQDFPPAQFFLGKIYYSGKYVKKDIEKGNYYLNLSSNHDNQYVQFLLGKFYYDGKYVLRDIKKAIHYLSISANQNNHCAQFYLGIIYSSGEYAEYDINKAIHYLSLSANQNDTDAQFFLGKIFLDGKLVPRDINKSIHYLSLAAHQNNPKAQLFLGKFFFDGILVPRDINKSIYYLSLAANQNDDEAQLFLGKIYFDGELIPRDIEKSIHYLSLAAYQNDPKAQLFLGKIHFDGKLIPRDIDKSIHYLSLAANQNDADAQCFLGIIYFDGKLIPRDINKSIHYLSLAANQNDPKAQLLLGKIYFDGKLISRDIKKSIHYLSLAANQNDTDAQLFLGKIYFDGKLIPRDIEKSIHYLSLAAYQNDPKAQLFLGKIYFDGKLIPRDINKSIHYLSLAVNQNDPKAQLFLGIIYFDGMLIPRDIDKSIYYLSLAANQYDPKAQLFLGKIYFDGELIPRDINKSIHYLSLAANQNDADAQCFLGIIYFEEKYIQRNIDKTLYYLILSSNQNNCYAQYLLGLIYLQHDINKAIFYLTLSSKNNYSHALYVLGLIYYEGKYTTRNINKAIYYLTFSNYPFSKCILGEIYYEGKYVTKDIHKAIVYFKESSSFNDNRAKNNLGVIYKNGDGVMKSIDIASIYFEEAIKQTNDCYSMYNLARIIYFEDNHYKSPEKIIKLLKKASKKVFLAEMFLFYIYTFDKKFMGKVPKEDFNEINISTKLFLKLLTTSHVTDQKIFKERLKRFFEEYDLLYLNKSPNQDFFYFMQNGKFRKDEKVETKTQNIDNYFYEGFYG